MAFPAVAAAASQSFSTNSTNHNVTMPATVDAGDTLVVWFICNQATVTTPSGWTLEGTAVQDAQLRGSLYSKEATGSEGGTSVNFVTSANSLGMAQVYRVTGGGVVDAATMTNGESENPDPGTATASGGSADNLFLAFCGCANDGDYTAGPTNYTNLTQLDLNSSTDWAIGSARRNLAAASDNPGGFTFDAIEHWVAVALVIAPAGAGGTVHDMTGDLAGAGVLAGDLVIRRILDGDLSGAGTLAGDLVARRALAGDLPGAGVLAGTLEIVLNVHDMVGSVAGAGTLAGSMLRTLNMSGDLPGAGLLAGDLIPRRVLAGDLAGTGLLAGSMLRTRSLSGDILGTGILAGEIITFVVHDLSGQIVGVATLEGGMLRVRSLSGDVLGSSTLEGGLVRVVVHALSGGLVGRGRLRGRFLVKSPTPSSMDYRSVMRFRPRGRI